MGRLERALTKFLRRHPDSEYTWCRAEEGIVLLADGFPLATARFLLNRVDDRAPSVYVDKRIRPDREEDGVDIYLQGRVHRYHVTLYRVCELFLPRKAKRQRGATSSSA